MRIEFGTGDRIRLGIFLRGSSVSTLFATFAMPSRGSTKVSEVTRRFQIGDCFTYRRPFLTSRAATAELDTVGRAVPAEPTGLLAGFLIGAARLRRADYSVQRDRLQETCRPEVIIEPERSQPNLSALVNVNGRPRVRAVRLRVQRRVGWACIEWRSA